jgi:hypothetical protein
VYRVAPRVNRQLLRALLADERRRRPISFRGTEFVDRANFHGAVFTEAVYFDRATFARGADFRDAEFLGGASFDGAVFRGSADLRGTVFGRGVTFVGTRFLAGRDVRGMRVDGSAADVASQPPERSAGDFAAQALQVVGSAAALALWLTLVGGAMVFARLEAADAPRPTRTVTAVPKDVLIAEGVHAMAGVLIAAIVAALLVYFVARQESWRGRALDTGTFVRVPVGRAVGWLAGVVRAAPWRALLVLVGVAVIAAALLHYVGHWTVRWLVLGVIAVAGGLVLTALALHRASQATRWSVPAALATAVFGGVVLIGGMARFFHERGGDSPEFERATVRFDDGATVGGLLVGRGKDELTLICRDRQLKTVSTKDARQLIFNKERRITDGGWNCKSTPARPRTPSPTRTVRVVVEVRTQDGHTVLIQGPKGDRGPRGPQGEQGPPGFTNSLLPEPAPVLPDLESSVRDSSGRGFLVTLQAFEVPVVGVAQFVTTKKYPRRGWEVARRVKLATASFRTSGGRPVTVHAGLSPTGVRLLRGLSPTGVRLLHGEDRFDVTMWITAVSAAGQASTRAYPLHFQRDDAVGPARRSS